MYIATGVQTMEQANNALRENFRETKINSTILNLGIRFQDYLKIKYISPSKSVVNALVSWSLPALIV